MSASTLAVRGDRFAVDIWEASSGTPTLYFQDELLPSEPRPWLDELARTRRVIAPRQPGFGKSTGLEHLDDVIDLVVFYLDLVDALGLESFDLIGELFGGRIAAELTAWFCTHRRAPPLPKSFGGRIAAELTAFAAPRVRRLVLSGATGLWLDDVPSPDIFGLPPGDVHRLCWSDPAGPVASRHAPNLGDEDEQRRASLERLRSSSSAAKFLWPIPDKGLRKRIHRVNAPTLLLWGEDDQVVPLPYARRFAELIPKSELILVPGAGHFPLLERPQALSALTGFLDP